MSDVYILGLACGGHHESAAALLKNGVCVAAAEEERFTRIKHDRAFPEHAIRYCLEYAQIRVDEVAQVGFFWQPWRGMGTRLAYVAAGVPNSLRRGSKNIGVLHDLLVAERTFRKSTGYRGPFTHVRHHLAHAASTFYSSPHERATILTLDGTGEVETTLIALGDGTSITPIVTSHWPHSLGHLYAALTQYLGFKKFEDEYKVMGLAAYGTPRHLDLFRNIVKTKGGAVVLDLSYLSYQYFSEQWYSHKWVDTFGPAREASDPLLMHHRDVAASLQARLSEVMCELAAYAVTQTGVRTLCLSGGVALNAVAVGALAESGVADHVYTNPVSGDAGCALGAAYYVHHVLRKNSVRTPLLSGFLGPAFSDEDIEAALRTERVTYERVPDPAEFGATLIAQGAIIGWFQGRAEYGHRALGARSILADPRDGTVRERLNALIKHREPFRPFAPSVLLGHEHAYFEWDRAVPYMTEVHRVRKEMQKVIPAVVHIDGSARFQSVDQKASPLFAKLIQSFGVLTGVPLVLNTSFNQSGEPIVLTPRDALRTFTKSGLDALVIGSFVVRR